MYIQGIKYSIHKEKTMNTNNNNDVMEHSIESQNMLEEGCVTVVGDDVRKRQRTNDDDNNGGEEQERVLSLSDIPRLQALRLEAIFYPKFENESSNTDNAIRNVIRNIQQTKKSSSYPTTTTTSGYLEVSIKHSGSLLLWSGGNRFYSKNSTENVFTMVGEILLRQHFNRVSSASSGDDDDLYEACSAYLIQHRYTLSFEVVTSVLGDHGAKPKRDYLILTAVADRKVPRFLDSVELIQFAQSFQLPHNDCWVFLGDGGNTDNNSSSSSVDDFFVIYDDARETALASTIIPKLTAAADFVVSSMYPHVEFQGDIMEGIVLRWISNPTNMAVQSLQQLARTSQEILQQIPPSHPDAAHDMMTCDHSMISTNLRTLYQKTRAAYGKHGAAEFEAQLRNIVQSSSSSSSNNTKISSSHDNNNNNNNSNNIGSRIQRKKIERFARCANTNVSIASLLQHFVTRNHDDDEPYGDNHVCDSETQHIANLVQTLSELTNNKVHFTIFRETTIIIQDDHTTKTTNVRYICIVHVLLDQVFRTYERKRNRGELPLFRGFSFELVPVDDTDVSSPHGSTSSSSSLQSVKTFAFQNGLDGDHSPLMLKMKFLPYMVRL
jgi:hypothetical protein